MCVFLRACVGICTHAITLENMPAPRRCTGLCWHMGMQVYTCILCVCYLRLAPELLTGPSVGSWEAECARRAQPAMPTDEDIGFTKGSGGCDHLHWELRIHGPWGGIWEALGLVGPT